MIGGEIAQHLGFPWLMVLIGLTNLFYGIFLYSFVLGVFYVRVSAMEIDINFRVLYLDLINSIFKFQQQNNAMSNNIILNVWPSAGPNSTAAYKRFYNTVEY